MTKISFASDVLAAYPEAEVSLLIASFVDNRSRWDLLEDRIRTAEQQLATGTWTPQTQGDPFIESWHAAEQFAI
jgi:hypothetical protein